MANPSVPTPIVNQNVSISDPTNPANQLKPNADGSIKVSGVSGTFEATQQSNAADQTFVEGTVNPLSGDLSGYLRVKSLLADGVSHNTLATVAQFHNADNQSLGTGNGLYTGGVTQILNSIGNLDRQRETSADQIPSRGIITGAAQFAQEVLATSTTSVTAAAATATLSVAVTAGFQVGGVCNFEPSSTNVATGKYEPSLITAVVANTSVTVSFPTGGALFTHTQPYTIQTFLYNQERDFSGEQQAAQGIGAAIASEFESNSGGPPLTSGLSAGWTLDADRNIQGKNNAQMAISSTTAGDTLLTFTNNPWTNANPLIVGQAIVLSTTANGAAVEQVIVSKNNTPSTGAGPKTVNVVNPVVNTGSLFATFDAFGLNIPATASPLGTEDSLLWLNDPAATDPKRPLKAWPGDATNGGFVNVKAIATGSNIIGKIDILGNAGATLDATLAAGTAPTNGVAIIGQMNTTPPTLTNTQTGALQLSAKSNLLSQIMDAAGNNRGANVFANNAISVDLTSINGNATDTALAGMMQVAIKGGAAGATIDGTLAPATAPANGLGILGEYLNNANQPAATTGQTLSIQTTPDGAIRTAPQRPATGDILAGLQSFTATTAATTIITIPANRTWVGTVTVTCSCSTVAASTVAGQARGVISISGTNAAPAAGSYFAVQADSGANAASGLVGSQGQNSQSIPMTVTAPAGNTVLIQVTTTQAGTVSRVDASAIGNLQ